MRITLLIEENRVEDASIVLETLGFVAEMTLHPEPPKDGLVQVAGEFPDGKLPELELVEGLRDWKVAPLAEKPEASWPWSQMPETD